MSPSQRFRQQKSLKPSTIELTLRTRSSIDVELVVVVRRHKVGRSTSNDNDEIFSGDTGQGRA